MAEHDRDKKDNQSTSFEKKEVTEEWGLSTRETPIETAQNLVRRATMPLSGPDERISCWMGYAQTIVGILTTVNPTKFYCEDKDDAVNKERINLKNIIENLATAGRGNMTVVFSPSSKDGKAATISVYNEKVDVFQSNMDYAFKYAERRNQQLALLCMMKYIAALNSHMGHEGLMPPNIPYSEMDEEISMNLAIKKDLKASALETKIDDMLSSQIGFLEDLLEMATDKKSIEEIKKRIENLKKGK